MKNLRTSILIPLSDNEVIALEMIMHARRCGNYTEILIVGEDLWRQIWDKKGELWECIVNFK